MEWKNVNFESRDIAEMCASELASAGIKTGKIFQAEMGVCMHTVYFVPYMPIGVIQKQKAQEIINEHLW